MLKNKKLITVTVAGLTLIGNIAIAPKCFADTVEKNLHKKIESSVKKEANKKEHIKGLKKKNHKGHNKKKNQVVGDKFEIVKIPIRRIDGDANVQATVDPMIDTYIDGKEVPEKTPIIDENVDIKLEPLVNIDGQPIEEETTIDPIIDTYIDGKEVPEKVPTIDPVDLDFEIIKAPIRGIDFDTDIETTVDPMIDTYIDGKEVPEKVPSIDVEDINVPMKEVKVDNKLVEKIQPIDIVVDAKEVSNKANVKVVADKEVAQSSNEKYENKLEKVNEKNINDTELPKTATNNFRNILLGGVLFIAGIAISLFSKKKSYNR